VTDPERTSADDLRDAVQRRSSFGQSMKAVAWSFFGIRRGVDHQNDVNQLNPVHVILAGLLSAALFVGLLVALVRWIAG
jgi:Protein of unknown function (DUF2970)